MGVVKQDPGARDESPFCDVLSVAISILCILRRFVESGSCFLDPRLISSSSESIVAQLNKSAV